MSTPVSPNTIFTGLRIKPSQSNLIPSRGRFLTGGEKEIPFCSGGKDGKMSSLEPLATIAVAPWRRLFQTMNGRQEYWRTFHRVWVPGVAVARCSWTYVRFSLRAATSCFAQFGYRSLYVSFRLRYFELENSSRNQESCLNKHTYVTRKEKKLGRCIHLG